jgi:hypothetical protein
MQKWNWVPFLQKYVKMEFRIFSKLLICCKEYREVRNETADENSSAEKD